MNNTHRVIHDRRGSRRPPYTCCPTRMTVPLTGTDLNLTPLSKTLRKAGYRGVRQRKSILA